MYLKDGCSLIFKLHKPSIPFVLNTNPIFDLHKPPQVESTHVKESEVVKRLKLERDIVLALEYFKSLAKSRAFKHTHLTYQTMIEKLGRNCSIECVQYLLQHMKLEGIDCSEDLFISVIHSYRLAGSTDQALKML